MDVSVGATITSPVDMPRIEVTPRGTVRVWFNPATFCFLPAGVDAAEWCRNLAQELAATAAQIEGRAA